MARSQDSFSKKEKEKKRLKKRQEKLQRKEQRKSEGTSTMDDMIAYVDANGNLTDTPPDPAEKEEVELESIAISVPKKSDEEEETVKFGILDFFNDSKGFGFIREIGTKEKYFVHINGMIDDNINEGEKVSFELERGLKGMNAVNVKKSK